MMKRAEHPEGPALSAYLDGELGDEDALAIREHGKRCERCRRELEELRILHSDLAGAVAETGPAAIWPEIAGRIRSRTEPRFRPGLALSGAAAGAAGIVLGLFLGSGNPSPPTRADDVPRTSATGLWVGASSGSLLDVYVSTSAQERTGGP